MKKKLVFCGECTHFSSGFSDRHWERCAKAVSPGTVATYLGIRTVPPPWPAEKNAHNDCKDFKRKSGMVA